ncbi:glycoside hydrolase domain-containing protein [Oceanobacillus longus]|uniref:Glycoside hydrolase domain-containing protein n=1 Tax=Oceanobacillus longus TaxID=930120 RepID=A0ABV8H1E1_9BACI
MEKYRDFIMLGIVILIAIPFMYLIIQNTPTDDGQGAEQEQESDEESNKDTDSNSDEIVWGVDSASYTNENLFACVIDNFGQPNVWGRYLGNKDGVSEGLDSDEVSYLHENNIQILVIYNHVNDARGYEHGIEHGEQAISFAEDFDIPEGVAIFVDIEPDYPVDSEFMDGWYKTLSASAYQAAVYGVFNEGSELFESYNMLEQEIQENTIVWTAYPQEEITSQENAPEYNPQGPESSLLYGWQYAIDAETCNIDTNLFRSEMIDYLW